MGVLTVFRNTVENHLPFPSFFDIMILIRLRLVCASYFYPGLISMIRNLNQVTFRCFGSVPSERTQTDRNLFRDDAAAVRLSQAEAVIYRAASETRISCGMGMSVLSASTDGETYQRFYLDKPAIIRKGVYFLLEPFQGDATVMVSAQEPPEELGRHAPAAPG